MHEHIERWTATAEGLGEPAVGLRVELDNLAADPSPARLARALAAAFWAAERGGAREAADIVAEMREALITRH